MAMRERGGAWGGSAAPPRMAAAVGRGAVTLSVPTPVERAEEASSARRATRRALRRASRGPRDGSSCATASRASMVASRSSRRAGRELGSWGGGGRGMVRGGGGGGEARVPVCGCARWGVGGRWGLNSRLCSSSSSTSSATLTPMEGRARGRALAPCGCAVLALALAAAGEAGSAAAALGVSTILWEGEKRAEGLEMLGTIARDARGLMALISALSSSLPWLTCSAPPPSSSSLSSSSSLAVPRVIDLVGMGAGRGVAPVGWGWRG